jgi:hypothetical protein
MDRATTPWQFFAERADVGIGAGPDELDGVGQQGFSFPQCLRIHARGPGHDLILPAGHRQRIREPATQIKLRRLTSVTPDHGDLR